MAKVTIVIEDKENGNISVSAESTPAFPGPASKEHPTESQKLGMNFLALLTESDAYSHIGEVEFEGAEYEDDGTSN